MWRWIGKASSLTHPRYLEYRIYQPVDLIILWRNTNRANHLDRIPLGLELVSGTKDTHPVLPILRPFNLSNPSASPHTSHCYFSILRLRWRKPPPTVNQLQ